MDDAPRGQCQPLLEGDELRLGGRNWIVPPLNFRQLKTMQPLLERVGRIGLKMGAQEIDDVVHLVHAALSRNYPDLAEAEVAEMIDLANAARAVRAVAGVSGLVPRGEEKSPELTVGEAGAGSASTGTT